MSAPSSVKPADKLKTHVDTQVKKTITNAEADKEK
jgi:hypothetical protein